VLNQQEQTRHKLRESLSWPCLWPILLLGLLAWLLATSLLYLRPPASCPVGIKDDIACVFGFQAREQEAGASFRWTDGASSLILPSNGYGSQRAISLRLMAGHPADGPMPQARFQLGSTSIDFEAPVQPRQYWLLVPNGFPYGDQVELQILSETMETPNGRALGLVVYHAQVQSLGGWQFAGPMQSLALWGLALSAMLCAWPLRGERFGRQVLPALGAGFGALLLIGLLALWQPIRVQPILSAAALVLGSSLLGLRLLMRHERNAQAEATAWPIWGALVLICMANGLFDWLIMEGILKRREIPWAILAQSLISLPALWWLGRTAINRRFELSFVLFSALFMRLLAFAVRIVTARVPNDADTELFYNYGRATIEIGVPQVEYPSGALVIWAALALPGSRELFLFLVPLLNLVCDLVIVWVIWQLGELAAKRFARPESAKTGAYLALAYAISPFLLPFWHAKFDPLPAAALLLGLWAYATHRPFWSGFFFGIGGTLKWVPWLSLPFAGWEWLRSLKWGLIGRYLLGFGLGVALFSLPFALANWQMFLSPYLLQGERQFIGESIWYPIALIFEPELHLLNRPPYAGMPSSYLSSSLMVGIQLAALLGLGLIQMLRPLSWRRTLILSALAPAVFLLLNRIYSPQYILIIVVCWYAAAAVSLSVRHALVLVLLATLMEAANFLVWPYTQEYWLWASIVHFLIGVGLMLWMALVGWRDQEEGQVGMAE
jgi:hypothetical protein